MKRPIKFRAWYKGEMHFTNAIMNAEANYFIENAQGLPPHADVLYYEADAPLMQFTGLTDKNGVEIYEGDIVKSTYYNHSSPNTVRIQRIDFEFGCFNVKSKESESDLEDDRTNSPIFWLLAPSSIEVIGNIHQNPEIL